MKIFVASDHAGFERKQKLIEYLRSQKFEVIDEGPGNAESVDYPDYADKVCRQIPTTSDSKIKGLLICGSGQGMAMRANKFSHIRAALCWSVESAVLTRQHNDANVLCMPSRLIEESLSKDILNAFFNTPFEGGRHARRVVKVTSPVQ